MLAADTVLDGESLARVLRMGHSRVPVHRPGDRTDLLGVVLVKELVLLDPDDRVPLPAPSATPDALLWLPLELLEPAAATLCKPCIALSMTSSPLTSDMGL